MKTISLTVKELREVVAALYTSKSTKKNDAIFSKMQDLLIEACK